MTIAAVPDLVKKVLLDPQGNPYPNPTDTSGLVPVGPVTLRAGATVLTVGAGKEFSTLAAAINASQNGDVILVDAGTYTNDFATIATKITIEGVGGMVNLVATVPPPNLKGILTVDNDVTIENLSFSGCTIPAADGNNGAGIRYEGGQMTLVNDSFISNQDGILAAAVLPQLTVNNISINHCLFADNGAGDGASHNCYISGGVGALNVTNSIFEGAVVGHELKSRALVNNIIGNVFYDGPTGTASYSIDLPDGGVDLVQDNVIEKGPDTPNSNIVHFGGEGIPYAGSSLTVVGNYFVNDRGATAVAVLNQTAISVTITDNSFTSLSASQIASGPATETDNFDGNGNRFADSTLSGVLPGKTLIITDNLPHVVNLTSSSTTAVEGGAGLLTVNAIEGHVIVIGGSGGLIYSDGPASGGNQITTAAGSTNTITLVGQDTVDSEGHDTIVGGSGNITATVNGIATIKDGTGSNQWTVNGTATMTGNGGNPVVGVGPAGNVTINGPLGFLEVENNGGTAKFNIVQGGATEQLSIVGGAVVASVYSGGMQITTGSGGQGSVLSLGAGTASITSAGNDTIWAGSGTDTVILEGHGTVHAGTGQLAVYGRSSPGATFYGNGGTYLIGGDTGNITYYGGALSSIVNLNLGNNTLIGGVGTLTINGGAREVITGGSGGLVFNENGGGANSITTAAGSVNVLQLSGGDVVNSQGCDTIGGGSANSTFTVGGTATITGSTGSSNTTVNGNLTLLGRGQDYVTVNAGGSLIMTAGTNDVVSETSATVNFSGAAGSAVPNVSITGGSAYFYYGPGFGAANSIILTTRSGTSTNVSVSSGTAKIYSNGTDVIHAGTGPDTISVYAANTQVYGGSGSLTLAAYGSGMKFIAGTGAATLALGSSGGHNVTFGVGNTSATVYGGAADVFNFVAGTYAGTDVISGFRLGTDKLVLQGGVTVTSQATAGGSTNLALSDGAHLQLIGVTSTANLFG